MRIIAGKLRSRKFEAPPGDSTRPTGDRARGALFNILHGLTENARVLDGFAGSGALSFEALSRGAAEAVLFETDRDAARLLQENAKSLGVLSQVDIRHMDFFSGAPVLSGRIFDLVFLDPPYASGLLVRAIDVAGGLLAPGGVVVAEHSAGERLPDAVGGLVKPGERTYGAAAFSFYKRREDRPDLAQ